jgi:5-methylcytosine-specific restriction endonuclease McrA
MDHAFPLGKGGTHTWDNIQLSHLICNLRKGDRI